MRMILIEMPLISCEVRGILILKGRTMKNLLLNLTFTAILLSVGYSQCNESNWQEYYPEMQGCDLEGATLSGVYFVEIIVNGE